MNQRDKLRIFLLPWAPDTSMSGSDSEVLSEEVWGVGLAGGDYRPNAAYLGQGPPALFSCHELPGTASGSGQRGRGGWGEVPIKSPLCVVGLEIHQGWDTHQALRDPTPESISIWLWSLP